MASTGTRHVTGAVYHQSTNGLAENMVKTFKKSLHSFGGEGSLKEKIDKFLLKYRVTPHTTTGVSPAELMLGRRPRNTLDLLRPEVSVQDRVLKKQNLQRKSYHKGKPRELILKPGDKVLTRNFGKGPKWLTSVVMKQTGPVSYRCKTDKGVIVNRHQDQIWKDKRLSKKQADVEDDDQSDSDDASISTDSSETDSSEPPDDTTSDSSLGLSPTSEPEVLRRSTRPRAPPARLTYAPY
jgi:hypothetical protein